MITLKSRTLLSYIVILRKNIFQKRYEESCVQRVAVSAFHNASLLSVLYFFGIVEVVYAKIS